MASVSQSRTRRSSCPFRHKTNTQEDLSSLKREIAILNRCRSDYVVEFKVRGESSCLHSN